MSSDVREPPDFATKPVWATALCKLDIQAGNDHNPYYWFGTMRYMRVTAKYKTHHWFEEHVLPKYIILEGYINVKPHLFFKGGIWRVRDRRDPRFIQVNYTLCAIDEIGCT